MRAGSTMLWVCKGTVRGSKVGTRTAYMYVYMYVFCICKRMDMYCAHICVPSCVCIYIYVLPDLLAWPVKKGQWQM